MTSLLTKRMSTKPNISSENEIEKCHICDRQQKQLSTAVSTLHSSTDKITPKICNLSIHIFINYIPVFDVVTTVPDLPLWRPMGTIDVEALAAHVT